MERLLSFSLLFIASVICLSAQANSLTFSLKRLVKDEPVIVTEKDFSGKFLLMAVGYTGCPDICPVTLLDTKNALKALDKTPEIAKQLQPFFITIDPISDTLKDITQYTAFFDSRIVGLHTDDFTVLDDVVSQLHASYGYIHDGKPVSPPNLPKGYTVMHSSFIYLYSPERQLLDVFPYTIDGQVLAEKIKQHIQL